MKIAVMGSGGVGGYFGGRLAAAGNDVTFVARGAHLAAMQKNGLRLDSALKPLHVRPTKAVAHPSEIDRADAVIFAVKLADTETAAEGLKPLVAKGASVFTFQNGVESAAKLSKILGADNVVPGVARIASHISEPGVVKEMGKFAVLEYGEADGAPRARTTAFHEACLAAGIDGHLRDNIMRSIWMKFSMLAPFSGMTSLARGPIAPIRSTPESRELLHAAVREVVALGVAMKTGLKPEDADAVIKQIDGLPNAMMSSMSHDLIAGKPIEVFGLSGAVVRLGRAHGVPTPSHQFITQALSPFANGKPVM